MNINEVEHNIDILYPSFRQYEKLTRGFISYPSVHDIKEWFRFLVFCQELQNAAKFIEGNNDKLPQ